MEIEKLKLKINMLELKKGFIEENGEHIPKID